MKKLINCKIRFSIIVSAYNVENYIENAINSVLNQTFKNLELIIVEDKSTDNTLKIIQKYKKKIKIIKNKKNKGLGAVRNIGIKNAKGEYIIHLDGDDTLYDNNVLEKLDKLIGNKQPDIVFLGFQEINGSGKLRIATQENSTQKARLICDSTFAVPSKCWRKKFLAENNIQFQEKVYYEDMIYSIKAVSLAKDTLYGDFPIFNYFRNRTGSIMTTPSNKRCVDIYKMLANLMEIYDEAREEIKPYILSFIINETNSVPSRLKGIIKAIQNNEQSPIFPKRQYNFIDIDSIEERF